MLIPYRTRNFMKRFGALILVVLVVSIAVLLCWLAWLDRFVVYTRANGAILDFSQSSHTLSGQTAKKPQPPEHVEIYGFEDTPVLQEKKHFSRLSGYYITGKDLETDFEGVKKQLSLLSEDVPVMMDVKSIYGNFFYSSSVSEYRNADLDIAAMDTLIQELNSGDRYTIARLPAMRDKLYGLYHTNDGLPVAGGYLWQDDYGCYWLNPAKDNTLRYLISIVTELKNLGFDEVVFYDFYFPETPDIVFGSDKTKTLSDAAQTIVNSCASETFAVSFTMEQTFSAPRGTSRIYLPNATASQAETLANQFGFDNPDVRVVFLTDIHDTRFDDYSVLRPIADAEAME